MKSKHVYILGILAILGATTILADVPEPIDPKEAELDLLLKKSQEQLVRVNKVAKLVDQVATKHIVAMEESIEELQEQNEQLITEIHEVKTAMESATINAVPFKLEPILSDSAR